MHCIHEWWERSEHVPVHSYRTVYCETPTNYSQFSVFFVIFVFSSSKYMRYVSSWGMNFVNICCPAISWRLTNGKAQSTEESLIYLFYLWSTCILTFSYEHSQASHIQAAWFIFPHLCDSLINSKQKTNCLFLSRHELLNNALLFFPVNCVFLLKSGQ